MVFDFDTTEYLAGSKPTRDIQGKSFLRVSEQHLLVCMTRSMLTARATSGVRHYLAASLATAFDFFVDRTRAPDFAVSMPRVGSLRDFSITGRVGEFAQGIVYALLTQQGSFLVCDFAEWSTANYPKHRLTKKPDFAVLDPANMSVLVAEAKGTLDSMSRRPMKRSLDQAKGTLGHPGVGRTYGMVVAFDAHATMQASIHIQDPEGEGEASMGALYDLFKRSYASWYDLCGNVRMAAWCRGSDPDPSHRSENDSARLRRHLLAMMGLGEGSTFVVKDEVTQAIQSLDAFRRSDLARLSQNEYEGVDGVLVFPDGTRIIPE